MKKILLSAGALVALAATATLPARISAPGPSGNYIEVRSCDVFTGACVANSEMGLTGREGMLVWSLKQGQWNGTRLDGLNVIAVVQTEDTLMDVRYSPGRGKAVLILDERASSEQREALVEFVRAKAGNLIREVVHSTIAPVQFVSGQCASGSCATVKAGDIVEISTRCLGGKDHLCGNEENYYPPLTEIQGAISAFTELAVFKGTGLDATWQLSGKRSAYLGTF